MQSLSKPSVLVLGGAGYIGSQMVYTLLENGFTPIVFDMNAPQDCSLVNEVAYVQGNLHDRDLLSKIFQQHRIAAVMHFASYINVAESLQKPAMYYANNVAATIHLLTLMCEHQVHNLIYSSSAAVYGEPAYTPIDESHPLQPINPYGRSKRMVEEIIQDYAHAHSLKYVILRYFNAAGADPSLRVGECHANESHLIPLVLQTVAGLRQQFVVNGVDFPTADGTCIRDFIHVQDICNAHLLALQNLLSNHKNKIYNLGNGIGYSVQEVITAIEKLTARKLPVINGERRAGDPAILVANADLIQQELHWQATYPQLEIIVEHAWLYMQKILSRSFKQTAESIL